MNKGITLLVLVAILGAMGLVLYSHSNVPEEEAPTPAAESAPARQAPYGGNGQASPLGGLQGPDRGLSPMEPPITSGRTPANAPEGAPVPVTLGPDGQAKRPPAPESPAAKSDTAEKPAPPASQKTPEEKTPAQTAEAAKADAAAKSADGKSPSSAPGLEPWSVPPPAQSGAAQGAASGSARNGAGTGGAQSPAVAVAPSPATPQPPAADQRLATDPIRPAGAQAGTQAGTQTGTHTMTGISLSPSGQGMRLRIEADNEFASKSFVLTGPDRLVIDLPGAWSAVKSPSVPQNSLVKNVRVGKQAAGTRLVLDLTGPIKQHRVERSGTTVDVLLY